VLNGKGRERAAAPYVAVADMRETYLQAATKGHKLSRPISDRGLRQCTAGALPEALRASAPR